MNAIAVARQRALWAQQLGFAEASRKAVETRCRAGDASVLDVNVARADLTEVQRQLSSATTAETKATAKLAARFPTLKYESGPLSDPSSTEFGTAQWRERILDASDSIRVAEWTLKNAELAAARAKADRISDPTVGIYTAFEAFRSERIVGLSLSIPLSGSRRDARMRQALQEAGLARAASRR